jgi:hypothetical protein
MINEVDESLRSMIRDGALGHTDVEIVLDAPTRDWAARHSAPTIDLYLYDVHEDVNRRQSGPMAQINAEGRIEGHRAPPRFLTMGYLISAWTQRAEDEHRLLSAVLGCFLAHDAIPHEYLTELLRVHEVPVGVRVAYPPSEGRKLSDVWSALGGDMKAALEVVATVRLDAGVMKEAAPLVAEPMRLRAMGLPAGGGAADDGFHQVRSAPLSVPGASDPVPSSPVPGKSPAKKTPPPRPAKRANSK